MLPQLPHCLVLQTEHLLAECFASLGVAWTRIWSGCAFPPSTAFFLLCPLALMILRLDHQVPSKSALEEEMIGFGVKDTKARFLKISQLCGLGRKSLRGLGTYSQASRLLCQHRGIGARCVCLWKACAFCLLSCWICVMDREQAHSMVHCLGAGMTSL